VSEGPRDFADYVFMRRAADEIGRRINGANWSGDEFEAALVRQVTGVFPPNEDYARALLAKHSPERPLPPRPRLPEPIRPLNQGREIRLSEMRPDQLRAIQPAHLSFGDFQAADEIAKRLNERAAKAIERRKGLLDRLVTDAEAGRLIVSISDERGDLPDMPVVWWRSSYAHDWFLEFQMEPRRPFSQPSRSIASFLYPGFAWLYVRRDRLAGYLRSIAAAECKAWWPVESESLKAWLNRDVVEAELSARLVDVPNPTRRIEAGILADMALEGGRTWKVRSIETTRAGHAS
jgi:hypothetical protein